MARASSGQHDPLRPAGLLDATGLLDRQVHAKAGRRRKIGIRSLSGMFFLGGMTLVAFLISYVPPSLGLSEEPVLSQVGGILIAGMTIGLVLFTGLRIRADGRILLGLILLFVFAFGSSAAEPERVRWLVVPFAFLVLSAVFFAAYLGAAGREPDKICTYFWVLLATLSLVVAAMVQLNGGIQFLGIKLEPQILRWAGWYGNPNRFGPAVALGVLASFSLAARARYRSGKVVMIVLGIALTAGVVSSGSRATLLALAAGLVILFWMQTRGPLARILMIAAAMLVVGIAILVTPDEAFEVYERGSSNEQRIGFVRQGLEMFSSGTPQQILFGQGYGEFQRVTGRSTHNGYVRMLLEFGVIFFLGMFAFLFLLVSRAGSMAFSSPKFKAFVFAVLGFLLVRDIGAPAMISVRVEALAFAFVIGAIAARPRASRLF